MFIYIISRHLYVSIANQGRVFLFAGPHTGTGRIVTDIPGTTDASFGKSFFLYMSL